MHERDHAHADGWIPGWQPRSAAGSFPIAGRTSVSVQLLAFRRIGAATAAGAALSGADVKQSSHRRRRYRRLDNRGLSRATLGAKVPDGVRITLVESADIGILGVGEGTFPTIRKTLARIGIDEAELVRDCGATFKQGAKFVHWRHAPGTPGHDHYLHAFQETARARRARNCCRIGCSASPATQQLGRGQHAAEAGRGRAPRAEAASRTKTSRRRSTTPSTSMR